MKLLMFMSLVCCSSIVARAPTAASSGTECQRDSCTLKPAYGTGVANLFRWYYDHKTESCKAFVYGGGGGNCNRFYTMQECQDVCGNGDPDNNESCRAPSVPLPCKSRWSDMFEPETGSCVLIAYGGCTAKGNAYRDKDECIYTCIVKPNMTQCDHHLKP
ncbi:putative TFPI2 variant [Ixodes scapularis]